MSTRKDRAAEAAKTNPTPLTQVKDHAFNAFGWAIKIPESSIDYTSEVITIKAYEPSSTDFKKIIARDGNEALRESLDLTPRESNSDLETGAPLYLLVGFTFHKLDKQHLRMHKGQKKQQPVGTRIIANSIVEMEDLPIMIVTPIQSSATVKVDLYALLRPKLGLCTPFHVGGNFCFYLPAFRNNCTVSKERNPEWNAMAAKRALRPAIGEQSAKQLAFKRARNTSKVVLEAKMSLQNEISSLVESFAKTKQMWHLKELVNICEQADEDLAYTPPAENTGMRKFVDNEDEFGDEDAELMNNELLQLWPSLERIGAPDLVLIRQQLVADEVMLEYRLIRPFIAEVGYQIQTKRSKGEELAGVAAGAIQTVRRVLGSNVSAAPVLAEDDESHILASIITAMKNMSQAAQIFDKEIKDNNGDQTLEGTLHDVWEKYANALDTDAAKLAWFQAVRYLTSAYKHKHRGLHAMIDDMVEVLEEMKLTPKDETE